MENELSLQLYDDEQKKEQDCMISLHEIEDNGKCPGCAAGVYEPYAHTAACRECMEKGFWLAR